MQTDVVSVTSSTTDLFAEIAMEKKHPRHHKKEKDTAAAADHAVTTLNKEKLLKYVRRQNDRNARDKERERSLLSTTLSTPQLRTYQDPFSIDVLHQTFAHNKSTSLKSLQKSKKATRSLEKKILRLKRARIKGMGSVKHDKVFDRYVPESYFGKHLLLGSDPRTHAKKNSKAWYSNQNVHIQRLVEYPTKLSGRVQIDEWIDFCRPYFKAANKDIGPDEDDLYILFQFCKKSPKDDFVLKRQLVKSFGQEFAKRRFTKICPVLKPIFAREKKSFTTRVPKDKDFPLPCLTRKSIGDAKLYFERSVKKLTSTSINFDARTINECNRKQKFLSAIVELEGLKEQLDSLDQASVLG